MTPDGYILIKTNGEWVKEHRAVMEQAVGRSLYPDETVHHLNGVRDDNRLDNLELWSSSHPKGQRIEDKLEWAMMIIERYINGGGIEGHAASGYPAQAVREKYFRGE